MENTHKFDAREFYSQVHCNTFASLTAQTRYHNERWIDLRRTKTLGWQTPSQVIYGAYVRSFAYLIHLRHAHCKGQRPPLQLLQREISFSTSTNTRPEYKGQKELNASAHSADTFNTWTGKIRAVSNRSPSYSRCPKVIHSQIVLAS